MNNGTANIPAKLTSAVKTKWILMSDIRVYLGFQKKLATGGVLQPQGGGGGAPL